jgi:hypothetical protein
VGESGTAQFRALLATVGIATDALRSGPEAVRASADQLPAIVTTCQRRCESHPCPDLELGERLVGLLEQYGSIARSLEAPTEEYGNGHTPPVANQLQMLNAKLTIFVADLGHAIEGH